MKYNDIETTRVVSFTVFEKHRLTYWKMVRKDFDSTIRLPFEMLQVPCPIGYDGVLNAMYGDWHTPVRMYNDRMLFDASTPYTEYLK